MCDRNSKSSHRCRAGKGQSLAFCLDMTKWLIHNPKMNQLTSIYRSIIQYLLVFPLNFHHILSPKPTKHNLHLFKDFICAKSISVIWKTKAALCLLSVSLHTHTHTHARVCVCALHIFHQHIHQCSAVIWGMWCAISLWRHCHRTAYFTSPPDAGLSVSGRVFPSKTKNRAAQALLPGRLAVSLETRQQRRDKRGMFAAQWKVEGW